MNKYVKLTAFGDTKDSERGKLPQKGSYWSIGKLSSTPALGGGLVYICIYGQLLKLWL